MKHFFIYITALVLLMAAAPAAAAANGPGGEIEVLVDGLAVSFDVKPSIREGRTMVPFRALAGALNVTVTWNGDDRTVTAVKSGASLIMKIGSGTAYLNGSPRSLDVPPVLESGRTLIPARIFSEAFGCLVDWDGARRAVIITSPPGAMSVIGFYALGDSRSSSWTDLFGKAFPETGPGNTGAVSELALGWYSLDREGNLSTRSRTGWERPEGWETVIKSAGEYKLKTEMVVHITDGDGTISSLLASQTAMNRAAAVIVKEAGRYGGVNLDFEGLGWGEEGQVLAATRNNFTAFVRLLSGRLKTAGLKLTVTLHPPNSAYKGYDYRDLGKIADRVIIMAYDYGTRPEPADMVIQAVEEAVAAVPPGKLILGISAPGETSQSLPAKVGIAKRYRLGGIALWRLGLVSGEMWSVLKSSVQAVK